MVDETSQSHTLLKLCIVNKVIPEARFLAGEEVILTRVQLLFEVGLLMISSGSRHFDCTKSSQAATQLYCICRSEFL